MELIIGIAIICLLGVLCVMWVKIQTLVRVLDTTIDVLKEHIEMELQDAVDDEFDDIADRFDE